MNQSGENLTGINLPNKIDNEPIRQNPTLVKNQFSSLMEQDMVLDETKHQIYTNQDTNDPISTYLSTGEKSTSHEPNSRPYTPNILSKLSNPSPPNNIPTTEKPPKTLHNYPLHVSNKQHTCHTTTTPLSKWPIP